MRESRGYTVGTFVATTVACVCVMAGVAGADHDEPTQAREFKASLVKAYAVCDFADVNAATPGGLPACSPGVALDPICRMDGSGAKGSVHIKPEKDDLRLKVKIQGVTGCEGETLNFRITPRVTTDNCVDMMGEPLEENCTILGPVVVPFASCVVEDGKCDMDARLEEQYPFVSVLPGNDIGFELDDCEVVRATGADTPPSRVFLACGVLVP